MSKNTIHCLESPFDVTPHHMFKRKMKVFFRIDFIRMEWTVKSEFSVANFYCGFASYAKSAHLRANIINFYCLRLCFWFRIELQAPHKLTAITLQMPSKLDFLLLIKQIASHKQKLGPRMVIYCIAIWVDGRYLSWFGLRTWNSVLALVTDESFSRLFLWFLPYTSLPLSANKFYFSSLHETAHAMRLHY